MALNAFCDKTLHIQSSWVQTQAQKEQNEKKNKTNIKVCMSMANKARKKLHTMWFISKFLQYWE